MTTIAKINSMSSDQRKFNIKCICPNRPDMYGKTKKKRAKTGGKRPRKMRTKAAVKKVYKY